MKLWLLSQEVNTGYDTYDSAVVAAETEHEAKLAKVGDYGKSYSNWAAPEHIKAELIGEAIEGTESGHIICASFNAG